LWRSDRETDQAPGGFAPPPGHGAHRVDRFLVLCFGLVAVFDPKVAPGAVGQVEAFGASAQVRKVVRALAAHEAHAGQR
jgi:hypothetical protein